MSNGSIRIISTICDRNMNHDRQPWSFETILSSSSNEQQHLLSNNNEIDIQQFQSDIYIHEKS